MKNGFVKRQCSELLKNSLANMPLTAILGPRQPMSRVVGRLGILAVAFTALASVTMALHAESYGHRIIITSTPSGATVEVDGERMGTTPFTWTTPHFGDMTISVSKQRFTTETKHIDYAGGTVEHAFKLKRASRSPTRQIASPPATPQQATGAHIYIATMPPRADIYIGDRLIGQANGAELQVPVGTHQVRFKNGTAEKTETMTFQPGKNPTRFVNLR